MDPPASLNQGNHYPGHGELSELTEEQQASSDSESSFGSIPGTEDGHRTDEPDKKDLGRAHAADRITSEEHTETEQLISTAKSQWEGVDRAMRCGSGDEADIDSDDASTSSCSSKEASLALPETSKTAMRQTMKTTTPTTTTNAPLVNKFASNLMQQYEPSRMELTEEEHVWAMAVKDSIENLPDLENLSDFSYAQLAIVSKGNVDNAIERAWRLQEFKRDNNIMDTLDDGIRFLSKEEGLLSIDYNLLADGYILAIDVPKIDGSIWKDPDKILLSQSQDVLLFPDGIL